MLRYPLLPFLFLVGCRTGTGTPRSTVVDSAGVQVLSNHGPDLPLDWKLERVTILSSGTESGVPFSQLTEYTVDADTLGHIYVNDAWYGAHVQQLDTAGHLLRTLTRNGQGPGEVGEGAVCIHQRWAQTS